MERSIPQRLLFFLDSLVDLLARTGISADLLRFGVVGVIGLMVDTTTVYSLRAPLGLYAAGVCGFMVAATANWAMNRLWTFRHRVHAAAHKQWLRYLGANLIGFVVNRGLFFVLITISPVCHAQPILAIAAGALAGLLFNFLLSRKFVFQ